MKSKNSSPAPADGSEIASSFASRKVIFQIATVIVAGFTVWVWFGILSVRTVESAVYVLDVGQGDSQLIVLASENETSEIKILIDGGTGRTVLDELDKVLGTLNDKYIDIVLLTHTDLDHLGGIVEVAKRYDIGLFTSNGRTAQSDAFKALQEELKAHGVPSVILREGDSIQYGNNVLAILSPDEQLAKNAVVNEAGIVAMLKTKDTKVLFTADTGFLVENLLLKKGYELTADVLKVGHHGSKYSSGDSFIATVHPLVSVIGVGKNNTYGHPTPQTLHTLELAGSLVYRTDENGTVKIPLNWTYTPQKENPDTAKSSIAAVIEGIMTGSYKESGMTTVSLQQARQEERPFVLVPHTKCTFARTNAKPVHSPVIISEMAWMGTQDGATHEWIELRNVSGKTVNISGWQLINKNDRVHITFPQQTSLRQFLILARSTTSEVNADMIFSGSLRNSNEGLRLFDNNCNLIDEVFASPQWPAGDNGTKQTMERSGDFSWTSSVDAGGTPRR